MIVTGQKPPQRGLINRDHPTTLKEVPPKKDHQARIGGASVRLGRHRGCCFFCSFDMPALFNIKQLPFRRVAIVIT